ncbi:MAG: hypothetical protein ACLRPH_00085 [Ruminococcus sp.]
MKTGLEWKKLKRTGYLPTFLGAGLLAAAFPVIQMATGIHLHLGYRSDLMNQLADDVMLNLWVICGSADVPHGI